MLATLPHGGQAVVLVAMPAKARDGALAHLEPKLQQLEHWHCSRLVVVQQHWQRCH